MDEIRPMTPGGQWLAMGGTGLPHYVVNPDHIARLEREGYQPIADPRIPAEEPEPENEPGKQEEAKHDDTSGRIPAAKPAHKSRKRRMDTTV